MISVIIPVYKVEPYLDRCLQSVASQTYKDLEIILIDDGSPDYCPAMCDKWGKKDARIKVVHKKNGGLSDARNTGLSVATGQYIAFLDSDDYIDAHMYEKLLSAFSQEEQIGISSCLIFKDVEGEISPLSKDWEFKAPVIIEGKDFGRSKILQETPHPVWNKLYRSDILKSVSFRVGKVNEDVLFMYDLSKIMKEMELREYIIPEHLIYYFIRQDSICRTNNKFFQWDVIDNLLQIKEEIEPNNVELAEATHKQYQKELYTLITTVKRNPPLAHHHINVVLSDIISLYESRISALENQLASSKHRKLFYSQTNEEKEMDSIAYNERKRLIKDKSINSKNVRNSVSTYCRLPYARHKLSLYLKYAWYRLLH